MDEDLKKHVEGRVKFEFYREGCLYYRTEPGLLFPVPTEDAGKATFLNEDKGIYFMRWIRKHLEETENNA